VYDAGGGVMLPVWRWDVVELFGYGDYRVSSISVDLMAEYSGGTPFGWRPCRMTGVKLGTGHPLLKGGVSLAQIYRASALAASDKVIRREGYEMLSRFGGLVTAVP
jgi:hypothetical protein